MADYISAYSGEDIDKGIEIALNLEDAGADITQIKQDITDINSEIDSINDDLDTIESQISDINSNYLPKSAGSNNRLTGALYADEGVNVKGVLDMDGYAKIAFNESAIPGLSDYVTDQLEVYENITNPRTGQTIPKYAQVDKGNTHIPLNISHANNEIAGKYIQYDIGANWNDPVNYPALGKETLATFTEGILFLDSKYFTPVDDGAGGLRLNGITFDELQDNFYKYDLGLRKPDTNTDGYINSKVDAFSVSSAAVSFIYRFAIGDYSNSTVTVYRVLISGTSANVITPVEVLKSIDLSDVVTETNLDQILYDHFQSAEFGNVSIQASGNISETSAGNVTITAGSTLSLNGTTVLINGEVPATQQDLSDKANLVNGVIPLQELPSSFNQNIIDGTATGVDTSSNPITATGFNDLNGDPVTPDTNLLYFGTVTNLTFKYNPVSGIFVAQGNGVQLGETQSTAYRGDHGKTAYDHSQIVSGDPHGTIAQAQFKTVGGADIRGAGNISLPASLPNPNTLTFTGGSTASYNGSTPVAVAIPVLPTRVKVNHTSAVSLSNNTPVTLSTTATALSTQSNARIGCKITFQPDAASLGLVGLLTLIFADLNQNVKCEFLIAGTVVDEFSFTIARTGRLQTCEFTTTQNITAGQVVSVRLTPAISAGSCSIPASATSNFITIS